MTWQTKVFASYAAWSAAGRPVGGVMPVSREERADAEGWPARYADVETVYYVALPGGQHWCPWRMAFNSEQGWHGDGWNVSGPPEKLTATPSINTPSYHGFLTEGVLTADTDGRTYPPRTPTTPMIEEPVVPSITIDVASIERSEKIEALIAEGKTQDEALAIVDGQPDQIAAVAAADALDLAAPPVIASEGAEDEKEMEAQADIEIPAPAAFDDDDYMPVSEPLTAADVARSIEDVAVRGTVIVPEVKLPIGTVLEKTPTGFVFKYPGRNPTHGHGKSVAGAMLDAKLI